MTWWSREQYGNVEIQYKVVNAVHSSGFLSHSKESFKWVSFLLSFSLKIHVPYICEVLNFGIIFRFTKNSFSFHIQFSPKCLVPE